LHMRTHIAEDKATLAEDTRGHDEYAEGLSYRRAHTLEYIERDTETLQVSGEHTIPFPDVGIPGVLRMLEPEIDWTGAKSSSFLDSPDKRTFGSAWKPASETVDWSWDPSIPPWGGYGWITNSTPSQYSADIPADGVGNLQRIWREIKEDSDQYFINGKLPFEQWSEDKGYLKFGLFNDEVERSFKQRSYSNIPEGGDAATPPKWVGADWNDFWTDNYTYELNPGSLESWYQMYASPIDANYEASQEISAWYWMADMPLCSFFKTVGGVRYEKTKMGMEFDADDKVYWIDSDRIAHSLALDPPEDAGIDQKDILPSLGFEFAPLDQLVFRASYSQTVARPTFKEMSPVQQQEYAGGDIFIGNPELTMSSLKNYDLRADWTPYQGGLVSASWFKKDIRDPIEYRQDYSDFAKIFTTAVNYPEGTMSGYEFEIRQHLGQFLDSLEGLSIGGNLTLINSEVTMSEEDSQRLFDNYGFVQTTRDMLNAPEYLYNLYTTYDIKKTGTKLGLFYTVKGDALVAGHQSRGEYVPDVYAKEYGTLNFSLSQKIGERWTLDFNAKNLLSPEIQEVYRSEHIEGGDVLKRSYTKGIEFSVSLGYEF
ncbi:MAG: TonB-dependent receptor, partial [Kiritimatiellales bacterium]